MTRSAKRKNPLGMRLDASPLPRILVVEDDASWSYNLDENRAALVYADNLHDGLLLIDRRRKWTGAIFDRFLLEGDTPFISSSVREDAGFILAAEFIRKFPSRPACIVSHSRNLSSVRPPLRKLLDLTNCCFIYKGFNASAAAALDFALTGAHRSPLLDTFLELAILQPNIVGVGLNVNEIVRRIRSHRK